MTKEEAGYKEHERRKEADNNNYSCIKCKFNLPGDIIWDFIKKTVRKLEYEEGHVIDKGTEGYQWLQRVRQRVYENMLYFYLFKICRITGNKYIYICI
jgi:hypothetical protein